MEPSEEEKKTIITLIEKAEKEVREKLSLAEPRGKRINGFDNLEGKNYPAAYAVQKYKGYEDMYIIGLGIYKRSDIEEIITHEAVHRLHHWTLAINAATTPADQKERANKNIEIFVGESKDNQTVLNLFDRILSETFAYWGEMVVLDKEVKPHYFKRESLEDINKFLRIFFPKNKREEDILLFNSSMICERGSNEDIDSLINDVGHTIALGYFKIFRINTSFMKYMVNYFTSYDIRKFETNPFLRYIELSRHLEPEVRIRV